MLIKLFLDLSAYLSTRHTHYFLENSLIKWASHLRMNRLLCKNQRVAILGASFNPTTLGHVDFIRALLRHIPQNFQKIDLIPAAQSPLKTAVEYASVADRLQILNLVLEKNFNLEERAKIELVTLDISRRPPSWMVMTLAALILKHRARESYILVCGYDHISLMQQWYRWQDLAHLCELYFYPRAGVDILNVTTVQACILLCRAGIQTTIVFNDELQKKKFMALCQEQATDDALKLLTLICDTNAKIRSCSATEIRGYYQTGEANLNAMPEGVSPEVHHYILAHRCYQSVS
ncbi:MAG: nicotinate-nicotinamide nucleotide adenylyltransferase [Gammaproteobacteria bacterium]